MTRIKSHILFAMLLLLRIKVFAQPKPAPAFKLFFEKVYLHTDRDLYAAGDTIWFKAYLTNGQTNAPIGTSGNLYVELINTDSAKIGSREVIPLQNGLGNGDFALPDSIPTGKYVLRAYTNWMRNFGDHFVFEKTIGIYNPVAATKPVLVLVARLKKDKAKPGNNQPIVHTNVINVRFYPEGGAMVNGLNSLVAVKAENFAGRGMAVSGAIVTGAGDTVTRFSCDTMGMGMLSLLPLAGQSYHASVLYKKTDYLVDLPQALSAGLVMRASNNANLISVTICSSDTTSRQLTLTGRHGGKVTFDQPFALTGGQALVRVPTNVFPEGITALTLYDDQHKPNCERLVYEHYPGNIALTIATDKPAYLPKGKTTVKIKLSDTTAKASLSMAVVDASLVPLQLENIASYLLLRSELKGEIEHADRYFDTTNTNRAKQLDLLLMTQGWRDFLWRRIADSAITITHAAEPSITLSGKVRAKFANKPIQGINISLTAFKAKGGKLLSTRTDSLGKYYFDNLQLYGQQIVSLNSANDRGIKAGWITMDSLFSDPLPVRVMPILKADSSAFIPHTIIMAMESREKELKKHRLKDTIHLKAVTINAPKTVHLRDGAYHPFGYPDEFYTIKKADEYFEDLGNWLAHNVAKAHISSGATNDIYFWGFTSAHLLPTFIVNGKEVSFADDPPQMRAITRNLYFNLPMDKVKKVTVRHLVGMNFDGGGIVEVFLLYLTIDPDALDKVEFGKVTATVNGYYEARTYYKPLYDMPKNFATPDYRTTIHWEPNITTDKHGEATISFYNADPKMQVRITVQGVTDKGVPVATVASYRVN